MMLVGKNVEMDKTTIACQVWKCIVFSWMALIILQSSNQMFKITLCHIKVNVLISMIWLHTKKVVVYSDMSKPCRKCDVATKSGILYQTVTVEKNWGGYGTCYGTCYFRETYSEVMNELNNNIYLNYICNHHGTCILQHLFNMF